MKPTRELQVQGALNYAIVDEVDNILIDEARTPLIISGPAHDDVDKYAKADRIARQLRKGRALRGQGEGAHLPPDRRGRAHAEELAGVESFYTAGNMEWPHLIDNALKAHHLYKRDVNTSSRTAQIVIVDEFTGRKMEGRQWSDGLHQAVEAKEGVKIKEENQTLATITLQNYFKLYKKLAGMTGTAMTEANEFWKIYKLDVVASPPTARCSGSTIPTSSTAPKREKVERGRRRDPRSHKTGRPILVGTVSIEKSELLSRQAQEVRHQAQRAQRQVPRARGRDRRAGGPQGRSPSPPTWPAAAPTSSWAAIPSTWPGRSSSRSTNRASTFPRPNGTTLDQRSPSARG
jgi:preprotein translocase subunit SecA